MTVKHTRRAQMPAEPQNSASARLMGAATRAKGLVADYLPAAAVVMTLLVAWELLSTTGIVNRILLPPPTEVLRILVSHPAEFGSHTWVTVQEVVGGYALGFGVGFVLGIAIAYFTVLERALYPLLVVSQNIPHIALGPILIVWLGYGMEPKLAMVALITFFPVTLSMADALRSIDPQIVRFSRSLGATEWQMFRMIKLPYSLPYLFTGIKVSATYGVAAAVIGEWMGANSGLGYFMISSDRYLRTDLVFASVLVMSVVGIVMFGCAIALERLFIPWYYAKQRLV